MGYTLEQFSADCRRILSKQIPVPRASERSVCALVREVLQGR